MKTGFRFKSIGPEFPERVFHTYKEGLLEPVTKVFGWDDAFQRGRLVNRHRPEWFHWVVIDEVEQALLAYRFAPSSLHVHLLVVLPQYQRQGIGRRIMEEIHRLARAQEVAVTLSCFKCSHGAYHFYRALGYEIVGEDDAFYDMRLARPRQEQ